MRILAIGDIVGRPGRQIVHDKLPELVREKKIDLVIANAENIAGGSGITVNLFNKLRAYGVDVITLGDHAYKKNDIFETMTRSERIVRPANLSKHAAGRGYTIVQSSNGISVGIINVIGRVLVPTMQSGDPFEAVERALESISPAKVIVIDVHAEATGEKAALAHFVDGRASFVFGTHTHVPTADARILPNGTAFITDLGMTGPYDSILGRRKDMVVRAMSTGMPYPFDVATGDVKLCGAICEIDEKTGKALSIGRVEIAGANVSPAYDSDDHVKGKE